MNLSKHSALCNASCWPLFAVILFLSYRSDEQRLEKDTWFSIFLCSVTKKKKKKKKLSISLRKKEILINFLFLHISLFFLWAIKTTSQTFQYRFYLILTSQYFYDPILTSLYFCTPIVTSRYFCTPNTQYCSTHIVTSQYFSVLK